MQHGVAKLIAADGEVEESGYTAVHVKHDGKWLLDRVTESDDPVVQTHYEQLKELEWMVGTWIDEDDSGRIETTCKWTKNKNFITRSFSVTIDDRVDSSGMQLIGWDPAAKQIRSWVFDSNGGFAEGRWTKKENRWYISTTGTLPDGGSASFVNIIKIVDENQFKWQSVNRTIDGNLQPNIDEVIVVRD